MVFCTVIFFKQRDATLIYTNLNLCKVFFGTPGIFKVNEKRVERLCGDFIVNFEHISHPFSSIAIIHYEQMFVEEFNIVNIITQNTKTSRCFTQHQAKQQQIFSITQFLDISLQVHTQLLFLLKRNSVFLSIWLKLIIL